MLELRIEPDTQLCATFMKLFGWLGRHERVEQIFSETFSKHLGPPSVYAYNALLMSFARQGDWQMAVKLYKCALWHRSAALQAPYVAFLLSLAGCQ